MGKQVETRGQETRGVQVEVQVEEQAEVQVEEQAEVQAEEPAEVLW